MQLKDKNAIVTGSAQGIGKSIALALAKAGANIVVSDVNLEEAEKTAKEIEALGRKAIAVKCNVADAAEVTELVKKTQETFDTIDILVNNAGVTRDNLMMRMEEKDWDLVLDVNLKGAFLLTKAVTRIMMKQRYGRIVNMSSVIGVMGNAGQSNYAASQGRFDRLHQIHRQGVRLAQHHLQCHRPGIHRDRHDRQADGRGEGELQEGHPAGPDGQRGGRGQRGAVPGLRAIDLHYRPGSARGRRIGDVTLRFPTKRHETTKMSSLDFSLAGLFEAMP